ncbi:MAG: hypothetical protein J07AB43_06730 [Candidatus Nanosalina sp. J07AB43]|nr:MAG: hypothetical protein J07AB43_06730 [Candidatus Nanosalina sp. J07AB43]
MHRNWKNINKALNGEALGGLEAVDGWNPDEIEQQIENINTEDTEFESKKEAYEFILGIGRYQDRNSFLYDNEDGSKVREEGFFHNPYCPDCLEDITDAEIGEDISPEINPEVIEYTKDSHKLDSEGKKVTKILYRCERHPETYVFSKETEHL